MDSLKALEFGVIDKVFSNLTCISKWIYESLSTIHSDLKLDFLAPRSCGVVRRRSCPMWPPQRSGTAVQASRSSMECDFRLFSLKSSLVKHTSRENRPLSLKKLALKLESSAGQGISLIKEHTERR